METKPIDLQRQFLGASLARWFGRSPDALLFFARDGRAWKVRPDEVRQWRSMGSSIIENRLVEIQCDQMRDVAINMAVPVVTGALLWNDLPHGVVILIAFLAALVWPGYLMKSFIDELNEYRACIEQSLDHRVAIAAEVAEPWRLRNPYRTAMLAMILVIFVSIILQGAFQGFNLIPPEALMMSPLAVVILSLVSHQLDVRHLNT